MSYYLRQGGDALPGVSTSASLFVCLSVSNFMLKTTELIFIKILPQMYWKTGNDD